MITVAELLDYLQECDPDAPVVLSRDMEGNDYRYLDAMEVGYFDTENGEFFLDNEEDLGDVAGLARCVALWPI
jgi:hypothetical protein